MSAYTIGADILAGKHVDITSAIGAGMIPLAQAGRGPEPALVIRVKNPAELVAKEGGAAGKLAFDTAPASVTGMIYSRMRDEFAKKLAEQGVVADVSVSTSPPSGPPPRAEFLRGMVGGGVAVGVGYGLWRLIKALL